MAGIRRVVREEGAGERLSYRLDRFLHLHPVVQLGVVLAATCLVALASGTIVTMFGHEDIAGLGEGLWWAITRMLDGGTVAGERGGVRRIFGLGVSLAGLTALAVLTGAFASSFADRVRVIRQGKMPIFERGHVVLLGWNARGAVVLRELAASGMRATVVILADEDRDLLEERAAEALFGVRHALRVVVKRGDPTTTAAVRSVAARAARVIAILPELGGEDGHAGVEPTAQHGDRVAMRSLLAVRRVLRGRQVPIVVEVSCRAGQEVLRLCAGDDDVVAVDARGINAQVLVHAVQRPGAFDVVRQILSLDGRSIHVHAAVGFAGRTLGEVHEEVAEGVVIGLLEGGAPVLGPDDRRVLAPDDRLLVLADTGEPPRAGGGARGGGALPSIDEGAVLPPPSIRLGPGALHVLVIRQKPELASILEFLVTLRAARVTVLVPPSEVEAAGRVLRAAGARAASVTILPGDPLDPGAVSRALAAEPDVALLLAPEVPPAAYADADSDQIITLLHLRRLTDARARPLHAVVELRSPETRRLVPIRHDVDFVLSGEVVGMLLAQELHALYTTRSGGVPLGATYQRILEAISASVRIRPLADYAEDGEPPTFARVAAVARARGEVAIGVGQIGAAALLLPERGQRFDVEGTCAIVLRAEGAGARAKDEAARAAGAAA